MDFEFDASDIFAFATRMDGAEQVVKEEMIGGVNRLSLQGVALTQEGWPVKTGTGRRSTAHRPAVYAGGGVTGGWGTSIPYGPPVENGRGPIVAGPGRMLRFEIGGQVLYRKRVRGARGHFMFRNAAARVRPMVPREFSAVTQRIAARLGL